MIAALAVAAVTSATTPPYSLEEFLAASERQNLDSRIAVEQAAKARADYRAAWSSLLPALTAQGSWTRNEFETKLPPSFGGAVLIPEDQLDGLVRVDMPLLDASRWLRVRAAGAADEAAIERGALTRDAVKRQVIATYFGYAAALAVREAAGKSLALSEAQLQITDLRTQAGASTELELLRAKAEVQRNRQTLADTEVLVATTRRSLQTLTGLVPADVLELPDDDLQSAASLEELEPLAEDVPMVRAALADAAAASAAATAASLYFVPSVGAYFMERMSNAAGLSGHERSYATGMSLTWRLDGPSIFGASSAASGESIAELAAERARLAARDQIHSDWQRLSAGLTKIEAARVQVAAAGRAAQVARDRYNAGAATQVDVIQAERDMFAAEVAQIQARAELASARQWLALSTGR